MKEKEELPEGWKWVKLGDVAGYLNGRAFKPSEWEQDGKPIIRIQNLNNPEAKYNYTKAEFEEKYKVSKGDLLFAWSASLGAFIWKGKEAWLNQHIFKVVPQNFTDKIYLYYLLEKIGQELYAKAHGSGMVHVTKGKFESTHIPLPPKPIQQAIASKIEELFSELDKGIENLRLAQQQLKTYRQSVLKWAFEGKLTNNDVKDGELPKGWRVVKIKDVVEKINNGYTPSKQHLTEGCGEIPFIKVYNLNFNGSLNYEKNPTFIPAAIHNKDLKRSVCKPGDVLINIVGPPLGKVSVVTNQYPEWNINQAIVMFRPNSMVLSRYISYFMQNTVTINWLESTSKATAGQWNVKVSTCRDIPFTYCPLEEQHLIVQAIESRLSVADKLEESITQSLQQAEALRQSILKKAFEGKLI